MGNESKSGQLKSPSLVNIKLIKIKLTFKFMKLNQMGCTLGNVQDIPNYTMKIFIFFFRFLSFGFSLENGFSQKQKITFTERCKSFHRRSVGVVKKQTDYNFIYRSDLLLEVPLVEIKQGTGKGRCLCSIMSMLTDMIFNFEEWSHIVEEKSKSGLSLQKIQQSVSV